MALTKLPMRVRDPSAGGLRLSVHESLCSFRQALWPQPCPLGVQVQQLLRSCSKPGTKEAGPCCWKPGRRHKQGLGAPWVHVY